MGKATGLPFSGASETWLRRFSSLLLKRRKTCVGGEVRVAPWAGADSGTRAWAVASPDDEASTAAATTPAQAPTMRDMRVSASRRAPGRPGARRLLACP